MKKITILILVLGLVSFLSCKKDETKATLSSTPKASVLNLASGAKIILLKANKLDSIGYNWSKSEFGQAVVITYALQMDKAGNNFKDALILSQVNNIDSLKIMTGDLNTKILIMEFDPTKPEPMDLEFRIQASINQYLDPLNSATVPQTITPYYEPIIYPLLGVPGSYQGWNPADSSTTIASLKSDNKYEGYIYFNADNVEFKYTKGPSWDNNWGDDGADGTLNPGGANIKAGAAGYYKLNANLNTLTHTFLRTTWGVIGDATPGGWNTDTDMTYDVTTKTWSVTLDLTAANIKFRANHAWDLNYGDNGANGTLEEGGDNIAVPSGGNYTVTMDLSKPVYKYKLKKN